MNFITINNDLCNGCNKCLKKCPKNAIEACEGQFFINYTDCISCGICFKVCDENAIRLNIPVGEINAAFDQAAKADELSASMLELSAENQFLSEQILTLNSRFKILVSKLNEAIVVVDSNGKISFTNDHFVALLDRKTKEMLRKDGQIVGVDIRQYLTPKLYRQMLSVQNKGNDLLWIETLIGETHVSVSIYSIKRGDFTLMIFRNMDQPMIARDQAIMQLKTVINQNMQMVQKIGFLLGEEVSESSKILSQTIKSLSPNDEQQK